MSDQPIKVLIVDDNEKTRDKLIDQLRFEDISVVGESGFGAAAYTWAQQLEVDVVIVSIEEPVARSVRTIESLAVGARSWPVLGISTQSDRDTMRKAVVAGVRDYLVWPAGVGEMRNAILNIHRTEQSRRSALEQGRTVGRVGTIIAVVGVKGGIGKSTVASNVAVALAEQTRQQIAFADLDLQFGDAAVMLDLVPARTIEQAAKEVTSANPQLIQDYLVDHASRVRLLAAPTSPEGAETITEDQVGEVLEALAATHDYVVVDTSAQLDGISMRVMDLATLVLLVVVPEVPSVRRTRAALTLMQEWGYSRDKVKLVVNRTRKKSEVPLAEIEKVLQYPVFAQIPDGLAAAKGITLGTPAVLSAPKSEVGQAFAELGRVLVGNPQPSRRRGLFRRKQAAPDRLPARDVQLPPTPLRPAEPSAGPATVSPAVHHGHESQDLPHLVGARSLYALSTTGATNGAGNGHPDDSVVELSRPVPRSGKLGS